MAVIGNFDNADLVHSLACMCKCLKDDCFKGAVNALRVICDAKNQEDGVINGAVECALKFDDERFQKLLSFGSGRALISAARRLCAQRAIELGPAIPSQPAGPDNYHTMQKLVRLEEEPGLIVVAY